MRIGLVRHFAVTNSLPARGRLTQDEMMQCFEEYDASEVEYRDVELNGIPWEKCYTSDLPRAWKTAEHIFPGTVTRSEALRETRAGRVFARNVRLPVMLWSIILRVAFVMSHRSQPETMAQVAKRAAGVLKEIVSGPEENVLIVSHGVLMMFLRRELEKMGFRGAKFRLAENGRLYVFESDPSELAKPAGVAEHSPVSSASRVVG